MYQLICRVVPLERYCLMLIVAPLTRPSHQFRNLTRKMLVWLVQGFFHGQPVQLHPPRDVHYLDPSSQLV